MRVATIRVTRQHINEGWKQSCAHCPVALAVAEVFGFPVPAEDLKPVAAEEAGFITADYYRVNIGGLEISPPEHVTEFMRRFDDFGILGGTRNSVRPITFTIIHPQLPQRRAA